jgi:hypothetical protein
MHVCKNDVNILAEGSQVQECTIMIAKVQSGGFWVQGARFQWYEIPS